MLNKIGLEKQTDVIVRYQYRYYNKLKGLKSLLEFYQ